MVIDIEYNYCIILTRRNTEGGIRFASILVMVKQLNSTFLFEQYVQTMGEVCLFLAITGNAG